MSVYWLLHSISPIRLHMIVGYQFKSISSSYDSMHYSFYNGFVVMSTTQNELTKLKKLQNIVKI